MRNLTIVLLALTTTLPALASDPPPPPPRVLMISLDGLKPEYLLKAEELGLAIPHLAALVRSGVHAEAVVGVLPSVTYPSHVSLITGVPPSTHGIESNYVLDPEDRGEGAWYWFASDIRVPTLVHAAEARGLVTGAVSWPVSIGLPADYLLPEFWRGWSKHPFDRRFMEALSSPGLMEGAGRFRDKPIPGFPEMTDRDRTDVAKWIIATAEPDLLLVHLFDLDFAQHDHGPSSPEALRELERSDAYVGELLASLENAGALDSTVVVIVSDHGFLPAGTYVAPNTLLVEAGLIRLGDDGKVRSWDAYFLCDQGSAALVLADAADRKTLEKVDALVTAKAKETGSGIFRVLRAAEARPMGSVSPLVLDAASGYEFARRITGPWSAPGRKKGAHGHAPDRPDVAASLVISGRPVADRGSLGTVRMTQIAPTVAAIMGLTLARGADEPIAVLVEREVER